LTCIKAGDAEVDNFCLRDFDLIVGARHDQEGIADRQGTEISFTKSLSAARSIPETAAVCQEWATKRMEMAAEDAKRLAADGQKFAETGARLLSSGLRSNGHGGSK
jgi:hypothetical protein